MERQEIVITPDSLVFMGGKLEVRTNEHPTVMYDGVEMSVFRMTIEIDWEANGPTGYPVATMVAQVSTR